MCYNYGLLIMFNVLLSLLIFHCNLFISLFFIQWIINDTTLSGTTDWPE